MLVDELLKCGINLMPIDTDAKYCDIVVKEHSTEEKAITDVATGIDAFAFRSCKWNQSLGKGEIILEK